MPQVIGIFRARSLLAELRHDVFALLWNLLGDGERAPTPRDFRLAVSEARKLIRNLDVELERLEKECER